MAKKFKTQYKTIAEIETRIDELIKIELRIRNLSKKEQKEIVELKRIRSQLDPSYKFFE